jgi:uncharacterized cupin superfamily protein
VSAARVNVLRVELDERLDEAGFQHAAATLGERLGGRRIGASVYCAQAGRPIWPYHYHHGVEEWLYVLAGAPVLRDPGGERALAPGDLVCFASGPAGAHTVSGPGRFVIFSTGQHAEPWLSVYPDSDKVNGPEGILLRSSAVGYWHGEGTAGARPATAGRPVESSPRDARLSATVLELGAGEASEPYHYLHGREDWLMVLAGAPTLRRPHGEDELQPGDLVCLPEGPAGARALLNGGPAAARVLQLSTTELPVNVCYPDSGRWVMRNE